MTDFIREWTIQIAGVIIFSSICEMIIPSGSIKKYIHTVLGMILILTVIKPVVWCDLNYEGVFEDIEKYEAYTEHLNMEDIQKESVAKLYKEQLCYEIEGYLSEFEGINNPKVDLEIETDGIDDFGEITKLNVDVNSCKSAERICQVLSERYGIDVEVIELSTTE